MRHMKRTGYLISAVLLAAVLAGCSQSPFGIFASVARERAILDDRNLDNEITVGAMTKAGTKYFLAAGALYYRDQDDPAAADDAAKKPIWAKVPAPGTNYTTTSVVTVNFGATDRVFAVYASPDGLTHGVYEVNTTTPATAPVVRFETSGSDFALGEIFAVNDGLGDWLVVNYEGDATVSDWSLYGSTDGSTFAPIPGTAANEPYIDVVADSATNDVLYLRANAVLTDVDGVGTTDPVVASPAPGRDVLARFTGALYEGTGGLFWLADDSGHLYSAAPGFAEWTRNNTAYKTSSADDAPSLPFTGFAAVPRGAQTVLLVGTSRYGYRVIGDAASGVNAADGVSSPAVDGSNYESSALATSSVSAWFVDPVPVTGYPVTTADGEESWDGTIVFAGTPKQGLWRALSSDDGPIQWLRE